MESPPTGYMGYPQLRAVESLLQHEDRGQQPRQHARHLLHGLDVFVARAGTWNGCQVLNILRPLGRHPPLVLDGLIAPWTTPYSQGLMGSSPTPDAEYAVELRL